MSETFGIAVAACCLAVAGAFGVGHFVPAKSDENTAVVLKDDTKAPERVQRLGSGDAYPDSRYWLKCEKQWKSDWHMREYCENTQEEAKSWATRTVIDKDIAKRCAASWSDDWTMFKYCAEQQSASKNNVKSRRAGQN